jgi:type II secretory pathway pseudopilin PulG
MLVVITIIALLAGLLIPMIGMARAAARKAKCETQMANIKAALSLYKDVNGIFPSKIDKPPANRTYEEIFLDGSGNPRLATDLSAANADQDWEDANHNLLIQLQSVDRDNFRTDPSDPHLRDPFGGGVRGKVYRYRPARFYPLPDQTAGNPAQVIIDSYDPPCPDSYQLWSVGPNNRDEFGEAGSDDLKNWKK